MGWLGTPGEELGGNVLGDDISSVWQSTHLVALANELLGNINELLELVGHGGGRDGRRYSGYFWGERGKGVAGGRGVPVDV